VSALILGIGRGGIKYPSACFPFHEVHAPTVYTGYYTAPTFVCAVLVLVFFCHLWSFTNGRAGFRFIS